jgi:uncharacterized membrane protein (UPF0182 family)
LIPALFVIAFGLAALAAVARAGRRRGGLDGAKVSRDIGFAILGLYIVVEGSRFWISYAWWREMGQAATYWQYLRIRWLPQTGMAVAAALLMVAAFALGRRLAPSPLARTRLFGGLGYLVAALLGMFVSVNIINPWTIALFLGSRTTGVYTDPIFHKDLSFYFFRLPFYEMAFAWVGGLAVAGMVLAGAAIAVGTSIERMQEMRERVRAQMQGRGYAGSSSAGAGLPVQHRAPLSAVIRATAILLLVLFAGAQWFARYGLLYSSHSFLTGADFVDVRLGLPLLWVQIGGALALALLIAVARRRTRALAPYAPGSVQATLAEWMPADAPRWLAPAAIAAFVVLAIAPSLIESVVRSVYVRPNELALERPYLVDHIQATRMAYDLAQTSREEVFRPRATTTLNLADYPDTAENLRLWDARPFQNDATQLQALRPYYAFPHVDVDRYPIQGQVRQVLIAARALDTNLLPQNAQSWVNLRLQYTHGYGAVAGLVNTTASDGLPRMIIQNAPPESAYPDLKITRPGIYFGEDTNRAVYVDTRQDEFDYPKGEDNAYTRYAGRAGIVLSSPLLRLAAAIRENDPNVLFTSYFTPQTRLLLHRQIVDRVSTLAPFLTLDPDPYLVIDRRGHLFWMIDAYTSSDQHPYAQPVTLADGSEVNYIRNSVKITVDAYNGTVRMYVFDPSDPILAAYRSIFPNLFLPRSAMPAGLMAHIRYPQEIFDAQAEIYRLYHMQDPQVFYNKEDQWDIARQLIAQEETQPTRPYYVMLRLPGDPQAEFVLLVPFTSHNRDNLIAWVAARCDPAHYGQLIFYRLPKEQLVYGPLQIESLVDQDRTISKDLSLWNQQGSRVIRATTLVLPVDGTFLYVEPIYIQAPQAQLPEMKKLVLAVGDRLVYADDLPEAMAELAQPPGAAPGTAGSTGASAPPAAGVAPGTLPAATTANRALLQQVAAHLARYQALTAQGQFAQAGAELQAAQRLLQQALALAPRGH